MSAWEVDERSGTAAGFHARDVTPAAGRQVWVHRVVRPAVVLGSTQSEDVVDAARARAVGVEVVRRRSGGGSVLVDPDGVLWVDLVIAPDDPLWSDDVGRAAAWVGEAWATALAVGGQGGAVVHRGALVSTPWSSLVCFGGVGPGEVLVAGRKVVGVAQRRTRNGARFQCAALLRWDPSALLDLLRLDDRARLDAAADLADRAAPTRVPGDALLAALVAALPS